MADSPLHERFWAKVRKGKPDECWEWTASKNRGYGQLRRGQDKSPYKAHRLSWEIHHGPIPNGIHVLHHCDNPACVNPRHLFLGTHQDNIRDMKSKGRAHKLGHVGERNPRAILTQKEAGEIRQGFLANRSLTAVELAREYKVTPGAVAKLLRNQLWHDPDYDPSPWLSKPNVPPHPTGVNHPQHKLTVEQVKAIRKAAGSLSWRKLAAIYGVSKTAIGHIINYKTWRNI